MAATDGGNSYYIVNSYRQILLDAMQNFSILRYCNRLWCTFELATFMKDPERRKRIQLMPLKATAFLLMFSGGWFALSLAWSIFDNVFYTTSGLLGGICEFKSSGLLRVSGFMAGQKELCRYVHERLNFKHWASCGLQAIFNIQRIVGQYERWTWGWFHLGTTAWP